MHGIYYVLAALPVGVTAFVLLMVAIGVIYMLRDHLEGIPYDVAYSSTLGSIALISGMLVGVTILQRGELFPWWYTESWYHATSIVVAVLVGFIWWFMDCPVEWADLYHHLVVAPLLVYLGMTLLPVVVAGGTRTEKVVGLCLVVLWAGLVVFDFKHGRLNQRKWLSYHGVTFKLWR